MGLPPPKIDGAEVTRDAGGAVQVMVTNTLYAPTNDNNFLPNEGSSICPPSKLLSTKSKLKKNELVVTPDETEAATERGTAPAGKGLPGGPKGD